jgi:hypothetical protein
LVNAGAMETAAHELLDGRIPAGNAHSRSQKQETPIENDTRTKPN